MRTEVWRWRIKPLRVFSFRRASALQAPGRAAYTMSLPFDPCSCRLKTHVEPSALARSRFRSLSKALAPKSDRTNPQVACTAMKNPESGRDTGMGACLRSQTVKKINERDLERASSKTSRSCPPSADEGLPAGVSRSTGCS